MDRVYAPPDALPQCLRRRAGEEADQKGGVMKEEKKEGREEGSRPKRRCEKERREGRAVLSIWGLLDQLDQWGPLLPPSR